jgi:hypothetical protein
MGIVKRNLEVEGLLDEQSLAWEPISDAEYIKAFRHLRQIIEQNGIQAESDKAVQFLENHLSETHYIFNTPGYEGIYVAPDRETGTFGYSFSALQKIERDRMNQIECIVTDLEVSFAVVFNHEAGAFCDELLFLAETKSD